MRVRVGIGAAHKEMEKNEKVCVKANVVLLAAADGYWRVWKGDSGGGRVNICASVIDAAIVRLIHVSPAAGDAAKSIKESTDFECKTAAGHKICMHIATVYMCDCMCACVRLCVCVCRRA